MKVDEFYNSHCKYYLALESDLLRAEPYVSFDRDNYNCFSIEFIKLFQAICSEIDVVCKVYCKWIKSKNKDKSQSNNINQYSNVITGHKKEILCEKVFFYPAKDTLIPWENWDVNTPMWWKHYNKIKHDRTKSITGDYGEINAYKYANLKNIVNSFAALYVLNKYCLQEMGTVDLSKVVSCSLLLESNIFGLLYFEKLIDNLCKLR